MFHKGTRTVVMTILCAMTLATIYTTTNCWREQSMMERGRALLCMHNVSHVVWRHTLRGIAESKSSLWHKNYSMYAHLNYLDKLVLGLIYLREWVRKCSSEGSTLFGIYGLQESRVGPSWKSGHTALGLSLVGVSSSCGQISSVLGKWTELWKPY